MNIRDVRVEDAFEIKDIYNYYILNSVATFEESPVSVEEIKSRIQSIIINFPWIVYEVDNQILGYVYANNWKLRAAYKQSVESSVYLKPGELNKGVGSKLYKALIKLLVKKKIHVIIGGISLPNFASITLHEKFGFKKVAHFKEVGFKFKKWVDVGYWQLTINKK